MSDLGSPGRSRNQPRFPSLHSLSHRRAQVLGEGEGEGEDLAAFAQGHELPDFVPVFTVKSMRMLLPQAEVRRWTTLGGKRFASRATEGGRGKSAHAAVSRRPPIPHALDCCPQAGLKRGLKG